MLDPVVYNGVTMPAYQGTEDGCHRLVSTWHVEVEVDGVTYIVEINAGFVFDGASVPRWLWRLCGHPMEVPRVAAALAHDFLYRAHLRKRELADKIYRAICLKVGMSSLRSNTEYAMVRLFGGSAWKSYNGHQIELARCEGRLYTNKGKENQK
ncbi:MAG: DUF1353 domain-containing protein [Kiritimatiellae bacterium]|nr:DUF1353 domain-containing protein [Kiritimatiellia bacterium]